MTDKTSYAFLERLRNPSLASLLVRIALGLVFVNAGWLKIADMESTAFFFGKIGFPAILAYYVAYIEFLGGIFLILGAFVEYVGILLAINMFVVIKLFFSKGFSLASGGYEYALVLALCSLAIAFLGAGKYSIKYWLKNK